MKWNFSEENSTSPSMWHGPACIQVAEVDSLYGGLSHLNPGTDRWGVGSQTDRFWNPRGILGNESERVNPSFVQKIGKIEEKMAKNFNGKFSLMVIP